MAVDFPSWSAWRSMAYGYSHLLVRNATHLELDFQSDNLAGALIDKFTLTKDQPCGFGGKCRTLPPAADAMEGLTTAAPTQSRVTPMAAPEMQAAADARDAQINQLRQCWIAGSQTRCVPCVGPSLHAPCVVLRAMVLCACIRCLAAVCALHHPVSLALRDLYCVRESTLLLLQGRGACFARGRSQLWADCTCIRSACTISRRLEPGTGTGTDTDDPTGAASFVGVTLPGMRR